MDSLDLQSVLRVTAWKSSNLRIAFSVRTTSRFLHNFALRYVWIHELEDWNCKFEVDFESNVWSFETSRFGKFPQLNEAFMWSSKRNDQRCRLDEWFEVSWDFWIIGHISEWCFDSDQNVWWGVYSVCDCLSEGEYGFVESRRCGWTCKFDFVGFVLNDDVSVQTLYHLDVY